VDCGIECSVTQVERSVLDRKFKIISSTSFDPMLILIMAYLTLINVRGTTSSHYNMLIKGALSSKYKT
jgi:hypothetical protein